MLYIIRHGRTDWNDRHKLQGSTDIPLNAEGRRMAEEAAEACRGIELDLCYSSPLIRARETAEILLRGRDVPILTDDRLREIAFGPWEGCRVSSLPPEFQNFGTAPDRYVPPAGAESLTHLCGRASDFVKSRILPAEGRYQTILVVSHGALGQALKCALEDKPLADFWKPAFPKNCSVTTYDVQGGRVRLLRDNQIFYDPEQFHTPQLL